MRRIFTAAVSGLLLVGAATAAFAVPATVQWDPTGTGNYLIVDINEFDWQSSGDLVIPDALDPNQNSQGVSSLQAFDFTLLGSTLTFDIHAHARLNDMLDNGGVSIVDPNLSTNGGASGDYEITAALSGQESAVVIAPGIILFTSISGTYEWYFDDSPDSDVASGAGFVDGYNFLSGSLLSVSGVFNGAAGNGSNLVTNNVTFYDSLFIETFDPANPPFRLDDTTFDTLISLVSAGEASATDAGDTIGLDPYTVLAPDLGFKADANGEFSAKEVVIPEPGTMILLGSGLMGLAGAGRRRGKKSA